MAQTYSCLLPHRFTRAFQVNKQQTKGERLFHCFSRQGRSHIRKAKWKERNDILQEISTLGRSSRQNWYGKGAASLGWPHKWTARARTYTRCSATNGFTPTSFSRFAKPWITISLRSVRNIIKLKNVNKIDNNLIGIFQYIGIDSTT